MEFAYLQNVKTKPTIKYQHHNQMKRIALAYIGSQVYQNNKLETEQKVYQSIGLCVIAECENEASNKIKDVEQSNEVAGLVFIGTESRPRK